MAFVSVAFAFPPSCIGCKLSNNNIISNNGKISKNTLKNKMCGSDSEHPGSWGCFSGEVELTGAVVSAYNADEYGNNFEVRFYPDNNLDLPFLHNSYCHSMYKEKTDCSKEKIKFERLHFGVNLTIDTKKIFLPKEITEKHLGENSIRAKVKLKDYSFYGEGEAGREAWATLVGFSPLGEVYRHNEDYGDFAKLKYGSKDSFINLRDKPNGNIIAQIQSNDMRCGKEKGEIFVFDEYVLYLESTTLDTTPKTSEYYDYIERCNATIGEWVDVFYLPPNATKPQEAIYGYIHKSQIKTKCDENTANLIDSKQSNLTNANPSDSRESSYDSSHKSTQDSASKDYIVKCDKCVISVLMNLAELKAFEKQMGDAYESIADDMNHYAFKLSQYLEQHNIEYLQVERFKESYTRLVFPNDTIIPIDSIKENVFGGYSGILYMKGKSPIYLQDSVDFVPEINAYFGIVKKEIK